MSDGPRPFAFEDLPLNADGKRIEPEKWGPIYSKPPKPGRKPNIDPWPSNCASGQKGDFSAAKHRAKLKAEFTAAANTERRDWAAGKPRAGAYDKNDTIVQAYERAMAAKRVQLEAAAAAKPKPHYVLRDGQWRRLAA